MLARNPLRLLYENKKLDLRAPLVIIAGEQVVVIELVNGKMEVKVYPKNEPSTPR